MLTEASGAEGRWVSDKSESKAWYLYIVDYLSLVVILKMIEPRRSSLLMSQLHSTIYLLLAVCFT
jgi:hypothetical protein